MGKDEATLKTIALITVQRFRFKIVNIKEA